MASVVITPADLGVFAEIPEDRAREMIADALAMARLSAPCLANTDLSEDHAAAAKAIIRGAILRWHEAGAGSLTQRQQTIGPAMLGESFDTRQTRKGMFWPSEIEQLQGICAQISGETSGAFAVDTVGAGSAHLPWCDLAFGATSCSCGTYLAGYPLWEGGAIS